MINMFGRPVGCEIIGKEVQGVNPETTIGMANRAVFGSSAIGFIFLFPIRRDNGSRVSQRHTVSRKWYCSGLYVGFRLRPYDGNIGSFVA